MAPPFVFPLKTLRSLLTGVRGSEPHLCLIPGPPQDWFLICLGSAPFPESVSSLHPSSVLPPHPDFCPHPQEAPLCPAAGPPPLDGLLTLPLVGAAAGNSSSPGGEVPGSGLSPFGRLPTPRPFLWPLRPLPGWVPLGPAAELGLLPQPGATPVPGVCVPFPWEPVHSACFHPAMASHFFLILSTFGKLSTWASVPPCDRSQGLPGLCREVAWGV